LADFLPLPDCSRLFCKTATKSITAVDVTDPKDPHAIWHGNKNDPSKKVRLRLEIRPDRIEIHVKDQGQGFDPSRVAINGDDLALITAARRPGFAAVQAAGLLFYRLMEARERSNEYPVEEINDYLRTESDRRQTMARTLAYFDPVHHVAGITATTLFSVGSGGLDGREWLQPLIGAFAGPVEQYALSHEGATDHDWLDAWMAQRLRSEPKPRLWQVA